MGGRGEPTTVPPNVNSNLVYLPSWGGIFCGLKGLLTRRLRILYFQLYNVVLSAEAWGHRGFGFAGFQDIWSEIEDWENKIFHRILTYSHQLEVTNMVAKRKVKS